MVDQWEHTKDLLEFLYPASAFVPALFIVGILALARLIRWPGLRQIWRDPRNRLFLVRFLIVFGLTQHDRVIKAVQPIHFAHGYDWMALFFLSSPLVLGLLDRLLKMPRATGKSGGLNSPLGKRINPQEKRA